MTWTTSSAPTRRDYAYHLAHYGGIVRDAAACALHADDVKLSISLLELGRGVLMAQKAGGMSEVESLREHSEDLVSRFLNLREALLADVGTEEGSLQAIDTASEDADVRYALGVEWRKVLLDIRSIDGFEKFLLPPDITEICAEAHNGPIVLLNVSRFRSDALIVLPADVSVLPLKEVTLESIQERAARLIRATELAGDARIPVAERDEAQNELKSILHWLGQMITAPVYARINAIFNERLVKRPTRLWWCPTGPLTFLPLHAAALRDGNSQDGDKEWPSKVIASYTPTIRMLHLARQRADSRDQSIGAAIVAVANPPGAPSIPGARDEAEQTRSLVVNSVVLFDEDATRSSVANVVRMRPWAHFACHARANLHDGSGSGLLLHDGWMPLTEIMNWQLKSPVLAFLSACSTGRGDWYLADEALHVASAFQMAGFPHVVGTLWPVADRLAPEMSAVFYTLLQQNHGVENAGSLPVADAIDGAVRVVRDRYPSIPSLWAGYIHIGP